ncbi:hypothetical protein D3C77_570310 [compost metagenome]
MAQKSSTWSASRFTASASAPSRCSSSRRLARSGSANRVSRWRMITGNSAAILSPSAPSRSADATTRPKWKITRRRAIPPLRSLNTIGTLLVASNTAGIRVLKIALPLGLTDTLSPPVIALSTWPSPTYEGWSGNKIRRLSQTFSRPKLLSSSFIELLPTFSWPTSSSHRPAMTDLPLPPSPVTSRNNCQS